MEDTLWSDTMHLLLSSSMASSIEAPEQVIARLRSHLSAQGYVITKIQESNPGTERLHARKEMFLNCGADSALVAKIEDFFSANGIRFTKHQVVNDSDHIDLSYELNNLSVWK